MPKITIAELERLLGGTAAAPPAPTPAALLALADALSDGHVELPGYGTPDDWHPSVCGVSRNAGHFIHELAPSWPCCNVRAAATLRAAASEIERLRRLIATTPLSRCCIGSGLVAWTPAGARPDGITTIMCPDCHQQVALRLEQQFGDSAWLISRHYPPYPEPTLLAAPSDAAGDRSLVSATDVLGIAADVPRADWGDRNW